MDKLLGFNSDDLEAQVLSHFAPPSIKSGIRRKAWAKLALKHLKKDVSLDGATLCADLAYLLGVSPTSLMYQQMCDRYVNTFG